MGHLGVERVPHLTRERFFWPRMKRAIHRPECYCLSRHALAVPSASMRGIIME